MGPQNSFIFFILQSFTVIEEMPSINCLRRYCVEFSFNNSLTELDAFISFIVSSSRSFTSDNSCRCFASAMCKLLSRRFRTHVSCVLYGLRLKKIQF